MTQRIADDPPPLWLRVVPTDFVVWAALEVMDVPRRETDDPVYAAMLHELMRTVVPYNKRRVGTENDTAQDASSPMAASGHTVFPPAHPWTGIALCRSSAVADMPGFRSRLMSSTSHLRPRQHKEWGER